MAENIMPIMDGADSPQEEMARRTEIDKREDMKRRAKENAEFIKAERARKRKGLK